MKGDPLADFLSERFASRPHLCVLDISGDVGPNMRHPAKTFKHALHVDHVPDLAGYNILGWSVAVSRRVLEETEVATVARVLTPGGEMWIEIDQRGDLIRLANHARRSGLDAISMVPSLGGWRGGFRKPAPMRPPVDSE